MNEEEECLKISPKVPKANRNNTFRRGVFFMREKIKFVFVSLGSQSVSISRIGVFALTEYYEFFFNFQNNNRTVYSLFSMRT